MDDRKNRACHLQECRGRPRCAQCKLLDEMYPPQRNLSGRGDAHSDAEATIPTARLIELETAEHERDILRTENAALKREAHAWSKSAEIYAASEAKLCEARLAELRYVAEAAKAMLNQMAGPARADALYDLRGWAENRQRADVLNNWPNAEFTGPLRP